MKPTYLQRIMARAFLRGDDERRRRGERVEIVKKSAEVWSGRFLFVERTYHPVHDGRVLTGVTYHEGLRIGPRGGVRRIFSSVY